MRWLRSDRRDRSAAWLTSSGAAPMSSRFAEWVEIADPVEGAWLSDRLLAMPRESGTRVGNVVPLGFEAYARLPHPARSSDGRVLLWAEIAAQAGREAHSGMQWEAITYPAPGHAVDSAMSEPNLGSMPLELAEPLVELLKTAGAAPKLCWAAVWEGYADLPTTDAPLLEHPARRYVVTRIPLEGITQPLWFDARFGSVRAQSPNLLWPDDRSWCVAAEIDFMWTHVAGSRALIDALLSDDRVEAYEVSPTDRVDAGGDDLNPLPPRPARPLS